MESVVNTIADYLVQQSLQVSLVFVLVLAGTWGLRKASAHWRYLLWLVVIGKCLTPTFLSLPLAVFPQDVELGRSEPSVVRTVAMTERTEFDSAASEPHPVVPPTFDQQASVKSTGERVSNPRGANHVSRRTWLAVAWMLGVGMFLVYVSGKAWTTHQRLKRTRRLADVESRNTVAALAQSLGMRRAPAVYLAEPVAQPFVWGWVLGDIYLPLRFADTATTEQRQAILTHELAHVARWDAAVNLVQLITQSIFFFHPLIWWANKRIREEREKCCNEIVLSGLGTRPQLYCEAIVEMLARGYEASHSTPALAITASTRTIEQRIATILTPDREFRRRPSRVAVATLFFVAAGVLPTAFVVTTRADTPDSADARAADATDAAEKAEAKRWQAGQVMVFRVINAETKEPIPGVNLELQNMGEGIDFQDVKVQTTNADGRSLIKLPDLPPKAVRVYPSKPGFVPLRVYWEGEPSPVMPKSITIPMEPGKKFGGKIRNESGEPIPGVAVTVHYWGPGKGKNPHVRANVCPDNFTCKGQTTSDEKGRWHIDVMPAEIDEDRLRVYVTHPDYISDHLRRAFSPIPVMELPTVIAN